MSTAFVSPPVSQTAMPALNVEMGAEGGEFTGLVTDAPIVAGDQDAFARVYALAGLNPADYRIVDETVRFSAWEQSSRIGGTKTLFAYRARFVRASGTLISKAVTAKWRAALIRDMSKTPAVEREAEVGPTYNVPMGDQQIGKKGTEEALANWRRGVLGHVAEAKRLIDSGVNLVGAHVAFQGDETEGVANNYRNQPHTVEMNMSEQLEADYDMRVWTLKKFATLGVPLSASSVISNHGEWTRNGGKDPITTRNDNASTHVARQVKSLFDELEVHGGPHIDWTIGQGDPAVLVNLSGVDCYFSHGYVEKGKGTSSETRMRSAIERQILGRTLTLGAVPLWFMSHYHHHYSNEFEGRTLFGCPALEAERSSEYMLDQYGVWSPAGMLGMLVGGNSARRWSNVNVF